MSEKKVMNRNLVVIGAILIQLCLGAIYAWSVFTKPLVDAGWTKTQTQAVFAAGLALFAIIMVIAGRLMPKLGPKKLAMAGGVVLGLGYILAGIASSIGFIQVVIVGLIFGLIIAGIYNVLKPGDNRNLIVGGLTGLLVGVFAALYPILMIGHSFTGIFIFIGIIGGSGIGLAYVVPIAVGMRWFPDKKGLITGLAVAGFGFGALLWVKLAGTWGGLIANLGLSTTFTIYGIIFFLAVFIGSLWMKYPPKDWKPEGWEPSEKEKKADESKKQMKSGEMLKTPQYYMILLTFIFGASAGLMSIGLMKLFPMQALQAAGISEVAASGIAGTAMAVFFSLANGLGRIAWGAMSDKLGRKNSIVLMMATQGIFVIVFQWIAGVPGLLYLGATLIGFNFGGNFALFPTITAETFGTKYIGQNYGWVFLAYGVGGIFGPILGGKLGDLGNFSLAFTITGILCLVAAGIIMGVKPPKKKVA